MLRAANVVMVVGLGWPAAAVTAEIITSQAGIFARPDAPHASVSAPWRELGAISMRRYALACVAAMVVIPASAQEPTLVTDLLPGHPVYHESEGEAGVVMAISITPDQRDAADLKELCEELRVAAELGRENGEGLPLEVIFVVPYKTMAIEGYYLPADGTFGSEELVRGNSVARETLDGIVARAGIPSGVLDETDVEHEISCEINEPAWLIRWEDVRLVAGEEPDTVIERAYRRFTTIHRSVVKHTMGTPRPADLQLLGSNRPARSFVAMKSAPATGAVPQPAHLKP